MREAAELSAIDFSELLGDSVSQLDLDQFGGLWAIAPEHGGQLWDRVRSANLPAHIAQHAPQAADWTRPNAQLLTIAGLSGETVEQGRRDDVITVAVVSLEGSLTKRGSSFNPRGSTIRARREVRQIARDESIDAAIIRLDTPGGTVSGTHDLAADIAALAEQKPVYAFCEDLCASAGYLIASQCDQVHANENGALIGSIGVFMGLYDFSQHAEKEGVKPVVIKAGELKATGFPGTEITEDEQAYLQELVDGHYQQFISAVSAGRGKPEKTVRQAWALGRVWNASVAADMGLIDGVQSLDDTLAQIAAEVTRRKGQSSKRQGRSMSEKTTTANTDSPASQSATFEQIVAACNRLDISQADDALFVAAQLKAGASLADAQAAWMDELSGRLGARTQELEESRQQAGRNSRTSSVGVDPLIDEDAGACDGEAGDALQTLVQQKIKQGLPRHEAHAAVFRDHPELREQFVAQHNQKHRTARRQAV